MNAQISLFMIAKSNFQENPKKKAEVFISLIIVENRIPENYILLYLLLYCNLF